MKYELKNKLLQEQLDSLSDGDFSKRLNEQTLDGCSPDLAFSVKFGKPVGNYCHRFSIAFQVDEILIHKEYDASRWNSYPDVTPPEDVLMRVETVGGKKFCGYFHTFPDGVGRWCCVCFTPRHMPLRETEKVRRFRPWK